MIQALIGQIISVEEGNAVIRINDSIEFELTISGQTASKLSQLRGEDKNNVRILTYLIHRDDSMTLFGFNDQQERLLFLELIKVNGIGPRQAIKILGSVQVNAFIRALDESDAKFLATIPGIGPKTSQKIILALRGNINLDYDGMRTSSQTPLLPTRYNDLVAALSDMGYDKRQIVPVLVKLIEENEEFVEKGNNSEVEQFLFKNAIIKLS
ncbi:MAG: Holliday junction branch migration protein RuvA [Sphaerochaetaceae bacterium]